MLLGVLLSKMIDQKGFTLIELLIVIGVIGVLATLVIIGINPVQQLARGRDAGRKIIVGQLSKAVQAYYTANNSTYPPSNSQWIQTLVNAGEIKTVPKEVQYKAEGVATCNVNQVNGWCYKLNDTATEAMVFTTLESRSEKTKCGTGDYHALFMWDSQRDSTCIICMEVGINISTVAFNTKCDSIQRLPTPTPTPPIPTPTPNSGGGSVD